MSRARRITVGVTVAAFAAAVAALAAVPAGAAPQASGTLTTDQSSDQSGVPVAIRVPHGNTRIATMASEGVQTYQCTNGAWTFQQPDAILQFNGRAQVLHTRGPVWTSVVDGSSVSATVISSAPSENANAIPQLLLGSTANRGPGLLANVQFVQRLDTTGGLAPTGACADGTTASVPYTADYTFWTKA
jgi:hypothetical protein